MRGLICLFVSGCCLASATAFADVKDDLQKRGVRISTTSATITAEAEVASQLKEVNTFSRKLSQANSQYEEHKKADSKLDAQVSALNQQLVGLNAQLANVRDVATNNRLVGAIGAVEGQLRLAYENRQNREKQAASLHEAISVARDGLLNHIVDMRKSADDVSRRYYSAEQETLDLIDQFNQANMSKVVLQPSSVYLANLRKLEDLEADILAEDIKLRREGNTYWANLKINGDNSLDMVVDSGANMILLSFEDAARIGLKPSDKDPLVRLGVADGRMTTGRAMTIKSMSLGQFSAEDVECVVLNAEAGQAAPLLGMTFLGRFKFQLDGGRSTLSLTKVRGAASEKSSRSARVPPFQLLRHDWEMVPVIPQTRFWRDRDYKITAVPDELKNASLIRRHFGDSNWLSGEIFAHQPLEMFVAMRSEWVPRKQPQRDIDDAMLAKLKNEGWQQIEGFAASALRQEKWEWVVLKKRIEAGPVKLAPLVSVQTRVLIFLKPTSTSVRPRDSIEAPATEPVPAAEKPAIQVTRPDWKLITPAVGVSPWSDRKPVITALPKELEGSQVVVREWANREWLAGEVVAEKPVRVYVALLQHYSQKVKGEQKVVYNFRQPTLDTLKSKGWTQIDDLGLETPDEEGTKWVVFGKQFDAGPITIPAPVMVTARMAFFIREADAPVP